MTAAISETAHELIRTNPALAAEIGRQMRSLGQPSGLTRRQRELLDFIRSYHSEQGVTPTYLEMQEAVGLASRSGIARLVVGLEERGHIERIPHRARSIQLREIAA